MRIFVLKTFLFCLFFTLSNLFINAQETIILRSSLGIGGSSKTVISQKNTYYIKQSIGQHGITGTLNSQNKSLIQGFVQPTLSKAKLSETNNLEVNIATIPFSGSYKIVFVDGENTDINVALFNMLGQKIYSQNIEQCSEFEINMDRYNVGCYIVYIETNRKQYTAKLLKIN